MLSVTGPAQANQMIENDNDDTQAALYWRQGLNVLTNELSVGRQVYCQNCMQLCEIGKS